MHLGITQPPPHRRAPCSPTTSGRSGVSWLWLSRLPARKWSLAQSARCCRVPLRFTRPTIYCNLLSHQIL